MKINITNPNKIVYLKGKIKKIDIINYYYEISDLMLPFVENRLLSALRCHDNINGECFFKKHPTNDNKMVNIFKVKDDNYFYINKDYQLIYQAQNGTIEFHVGASTIKNINKPNVMVFDLDPDENMPLKKLKEAVIKLKSLLDELNLISFLKTSGGKGYHIVVPFKESKSFKSFYEFSKKIALICENKWPETFTTNIKKSSRKNKVFIDYLRNNKSSSCIAPYSLRARDNAPISFPISYNDLNNINPNEINIKNYKNYLNDSWKDFFKIQQKLK